MRPGVQRLHERADTLLTRLRLADRHDKSYTRQRNAWIGGAIGLGILGIVATIIASETRAVRRVVTPETVFFFIAVPLVLLCVVQAVRYHRLDFDDRKLALLLRLVTMLRADLRSAERVALTVDLRSYARGGTIVERTGWFLGNSVKKYRHPWLALRVTLADGNVLVVGVVDRVTVRQKRKTSGGKTKYKTRVRARSDVRLALRLAKRYRPAAAAADALRGRSVAGLAFDAVTAAQDGTRLDVVFRSPTVTDVSTLPGAEPVLGVLRWLYAGLAARATRTA